MRGPRRRARRWPSPVGRRHVYGRGRLPRQQRLRERPEPAGHLRDHRAPRGHRVLHHRGPDVIGRIDGLWGARHPDRRRDARQPRAGTPTGTVTFFDGTSELGAVTLDGSGRATLTVSSLAVGGHSITAVYGAAAGFLGGQSGAVSQSVTPDGTAVVLVPHAVLKKKKVVSLTLTAQVEPIAPGGGVPTGVVTFKIKKKTLGTVALVGGQATLPVKASSVLNKPITVIYTGGGDFQSSTLAPTKLTSRSLARPTHSLARKTAHTTAPPGAISRKSRKI